MKRHFFSGLPVCLIIFLVACHKCTDPTNPQCSNYNPCYGIMPTTAQFTMTEYSNTVYLDSLLKPYWRVYNSDSAMYQVIFSAALDSAVYEWHIGSGVYNSKSFTLDFSAVTPRPAIIPVTLIVHKQPNQKCFPGGKTSDTITRNLYIVAPPDSIYFTGTYQGAFSDAPNTQVTYSIVKKPLTYYPYSKYEIVNFFTPGDSTQIGTGTSNFLTLIYERYFDFEDTTGSIEYSVISSLNPSDNEVTATFETNNLNSMVKTLRFFKGQKIK